MKLKFVDIYYNLISDCCRENSRNCIIRPNSSSFDNSFPVIDLIYVYVSYTGIIYAAIAGVEITSSLG